MEIGIIGTGNVGATLARKLIASGHHVKLGQNISGVGPNQLVESVS
ncbi:MAG TPA: hypothetical protein DER40_18945 [Geobacter sp.]|nr:hypothetical protein [Geobacter sp.]HCE69498.1 hypothetical protein [Geobacter sp.]